MKQKPKNELPKAVQNRLAGKERRDAMREDFNRRLEAEKRGRQK